MVAALRPRTWPVAGALVVALAVPLAASAAVRADLPSPEQQRVVEYASGGAPRQHAGAVERAGSRYPLELDFLLSGSAYAPANVPVTIRDRSGRVVLDTVARGPIMMVALPPGRYTVSARDGRKSEVLRANVERGRHEILALDWKGCADAAAGC